MHYFLVQLARALQERDLDRFEDIAVAMLAGFDTTLQSLNVDRELEQRQMKVLRRRLGGVSKLKLTWGGYPTSFFINLFTQVLLVRKVYPEQTDLRLARAIEMVQSNISWGRENFEAVNWNFKFHLHRALLRNALTYGDPYLFEDATELLRKAERAMPDLVYFLVKVVIDRLIHEPEGNLFDTRPNLFNVFIEVLQGASFEKTGNSVKHLIARLLCGDAKVFEEYLAVRAIDLPFYVTVGKACLGDDDKSALAWSCDHEQLVFEPDFCNQVKDILTRDARSFTIFLFATHGREHKRFGWMKNKLHLLDYSLPEWSLQLGAKLHQNIFFYCSYEIEHLVCRTPTHLAVEALRRYCKNLAPEDLIGLPEDRLDIFLREGVLYHPSGVCHDLVKWKEPYPNWLIVKDDDDDRAKTMKGVLIGKVQLKAMVKMLWGDDGVLDNVIRRKLLDLIFDTVFRPIRNEYNRKPDPIVGPDSSPVFTYLRSLPSSADDDDAFSLSSQKKFDFDHFDKLFDAYLLEDIEKFHFWEKLWYMIPDHLIFDPPLGRYADDGIRGLRTLKGLRLKSALEGVLEHPIQEYRQRMDLILEKTDEWWKECRSNPFH